MYGTAAVQLHRLEAEQCLGRIPFGEQGPCWDDIDNSGKYRRHVIGYSIGGRVQEPKAKDGVKMRVEPCLWLEAWDTASHCVLSSSALLLDIFSKSVPSLMSRNLQRRRRRARLVFATLVLFAKSASAQTHTFVWGFSGVSVPFFMLIYSF